MNKKKILSLALVLLLIATLSFGTLAWFNDTKEVENTFHIATSDDGDGKIDPDEIFSVDVWENTDPDGGDDDGDGKVDEDNKDGDGLRFDNIVPGGKYHKNPYIENTGAYDQYIRASVKVTEGKAWAQILGEGYDLSQIFLGYEDAKWTFAEKIYVEKDDAWVYYYYLNEKLVAGEEVSLFTDVQLPTFLTQEHMAKLGKDFAITVKAEAMQADNTGANAKEAFEEVAGWKCGAEYAG